MLPSKENKNKQLGMNHGTANTRLKKNIFFHLVQATKMDTCYQCGKKIETPRELSVEHIEPWFNTDDPVGNFFDINNIAFSHLSCNSAAARKPHKYVTEEERKAALRDNERRSREKAKNKTK